MMRQYELVERVQTYNPAADEQLLNRAYVYAMKAHGAQTRASGDPYFAHPIEVAGILTDYRLDTATIVTALLHDVIEDTPVTADDLRREGFHEAVIAAVLCVTHRKDEPYADYVVRCKGNEVARRVKLADLEDNARLSRTLLRRGRVASDLDRIRRYVLSYKFLTDQITEAQYRAAMEGNGR